jgi:uncharacterized protein (DUF4415 family)
MPYPPASEPLTKITINLYAKDVLNLQLRYGRGYQQKIREIVREAMDADAQGESDNGFLSEYET